MDDEIITLAEIIKRIDKERETKCPTGFPPLDRVMYGGFSPALYLLAADPGMGKTALILSMMYQQATRYKMLSVLLTTTIKLHLVRRLRLMFEDFPTDMIYASTVRNLSGVCEFVRNAVRKGIKIIYINDLKFPFDNRTNELSPAERVEFLCTLSHLAEELRIAIVVLAPTNFGKNNGVCRPNYDDLNISEAEKMVIRDVMLLYRPEFCGISHDEYGMPLDGFAEIIIGECTLYLYFDKPYCRFLALEDMPDRGF
ncbi:DnaB-like helicase C-terminal domain-containing protein [Alistipes provencensis]|uniref:DnaB-like helicase C-terminal domain-containing protein n=1 Tax=Alistipes provencensis TaxID=1816676 RepID=UPI0007ED156E|nr:DnaB-like helicase C-terminal domain-containing protein [Alistipes provencensis]